MAHPRTDIRLAVIALLVAANTAAANRVEDSPVDPHKKSKLPVLGVYTLNETSEKIEGSAPEETAHACSVEVAAWVGGVDPAAVMLALDNLDTEISAVFDGNPNLFYNGVNNAGGSERVDMEIEIRAENGASSPLVGIMVITYSVLYRTTPAAPDIVDDFETVEATHRLEGGIVGDTEPAVDTFTVQEP